MVIVASGATLTTSDETVEDVVIAALRKIVGISEVPAAEQAAMGLEALNNMLAEWAGHGVDVGLTLPTTLGAVLAVDRSFVSGIKANLTVALCDDFDRDVTPSLLQRARVGYEHIKQALAPAYTNEYF